MYGNFYIVSSGAVNITLASLFVIISAIFISKIKIKFLDHVAKVLWVLFILKFFNDFYHGVMFLTHREALLADYGNVAWFQSDVIITLYFLIEMTVDLIYYNFVYELILLRVILDSQSKQKFIKNS